MSNFNAFVKNSITKFLISLQSMYIDLDNFRFTHPYANIHIRVTVTRTDFFTACRKGIAL